MCNRKAWMYAIVFGVIFPGVIFLIMEYIIVDLPQDPYTTIPEASANTVATTEISIDPDTYCIPVLYADQSIQSMALEEYVTGVVLAEMPAEFETEALKAQAVVARTYALKRHRSGNKHGQGAVCCDHRCCQAYCAEDEYSGDAVNLDRVTTAVRATQNMVLTYEGQLIEATYFSCSGGRTEDAREVWGTEFPYLQSVESPGEEISDHYIETRSFSVQEFGERLGFNNDAITFGDITYTEGGGIRSMEINGVIFEGTELRSLLELNSTVFVITAVNDTVTVTTKGYGHRVGMSQYGAEVMAVQGRDYTQILSHYYPGTTLEDFTDN